jgi:hypothetical protein
VDCIFKQLSPGKVQCTECEAVVRSRRPPEEVHRNCVKAAPPSLNSITPREKPPPHVYPPRGPGTELLLLIHENGGPPPCQRCIEMAAQMDAWGADECERRKPEIVKALRQNFWKLGILDKLKAASAGLSARATTRWFVEEAIRRSKAEVASE